jgi:rifampicin phosphotransferase
MQVRDIRAAGTSDGMNVEPVPVPAEPPPGFWERESTHFPQPLSPAMRSAFLHVPNESWRQLFADCGLLLDGIELREIGGWVYMRAVPLGGKDQAAPPGLIMKALTWLPPLRGRIRQCQRVLREGTVWQWFDRWEGEWRPAIIAENVALRSVDLEALSDGELIAHLARTRRHLEHALDVHYRLSAPNGLAVSELVLACRDLLGWDDRQSLRLVGGLSEKSSEPARQLAEVAAMVAAREPVRALIENPHTATLDALRALDPEVARAVDRYIDAYGCRALRYEFTDPALEETPDLVLRLVADQLATGYDPIARAAALTAERERAEAEARAALASRPEQLAHFEVLLDRAKRGYPLREENEFYTVSVPFALGRYALLEAGRRLSARSQIDRAGDVMQLEWDESVAALSSGESCRELVAQRQGERAWVLAHPGPASYGPPPPPPPSMSVFPPEVQLVHEMLEWEMDRNFSAPVMDHEERVLRGIAASDGTYTGPARIVMDESQFDRIQAGDVLVCPITSPVWSVLFASIGALVTQYGGVLAHPAIIAREYRIPAVVAVGDVTELLEDGQLVTVDGTTGEIRIEAS